MSGYRKKSDKQRDRIQRMKRSDQEKYAEEAFHELNERGQGEAFWDYLTGKTDNPRQARKE